MAATKKASPKNTPVKKAPVKKAPVKQASSKLSNVKQVVSPADRNPGIDWRSLYLYAVSLVTLLVVLFSTISLVNAIVNFAFPDPLYIDPYTKLENKPDPALIQQQEANSHRQALKNIFNTFTTMAIATPVYLYHWKQARKSSH